MNFGEALEALKQGYRVLRPGWNGHGMWLRLEPADGEWQAFIAMRTVQGSFVPWLASQTDLLAEDWEVLP